MDIQSAQALRLQAHGITAPLPDALAVTERLGALQAQDYTNALWALGLRTASASQADIEQALSQRKIIRTWPMRGTLHIIPAADARWMLNLLTPRIIARSATRHRMLDLDAEVFATANAVLTRVLADGKPVRRDALFTALQQAGIATDNQRGYHILLKASQETLICLGPPDGKQPTFVLFDAWVTQSNTPSRDEGLAILADRYFGGHGPARISDFAGWANLTMADAKRGIAGAGSALTAVSVEGTEHWMQAGATVKSAAPEALHLLPGFDEYILGYKDRSLIFTDTAHLSRIVPGSNGVFLPTIIKGGHVVGTWKRVVSKSAVHISLTTFDAPFSAQDRQQLHVRAERYAAFLGSDLGTVDFL